MKNKDIRETIELYAKNFTTSGLIKNGEKCARCVLENSFIENKRKIKKVIQELGVRALGEELTKIGLAELAEKMEEE